MINYAIERPEIAQLQQLLGLKFAEPWQVTIYFEKIIADFFGAPYAVSTDSCTHAMELVLRYIEHQNTIMMPRHTYMSVPMMLDKLKIDYQFQNQHWQEYYDLVPNLVRDAAWMWRKNSYQSGTFTCLSFQNKKHLKIGRGGAILTDSAQAYQDLMFMKYDGRPPHLLQQHADVKTCGYHYYMTPDDAARGILLFNVLADVPCAVRGWKDYRDLGEFSYFKNRVFID